MKILLIIHTLLLVFCFFYVSLYSISETPIRHNKLNKMQNVSFFPQGWAFFTKDPKENTFVLYKSNKKGDYEADIEITGHISNFCGLNRISRVQNQEFARFYSNIPEMNFRKINGNLNFNKSVIDTLKKFTISNPSKYPQFLGEYVVRSVGTVPWAWAKNFNSERYQSSKICKINVITSK